MSIDRAIHIQDLSYQYPRVSGWALRDLNLSVRRGEFLGIVGPTGAGKTTLCLACNGIVPQFHGGRFFGRVSTAGLDTVDTPIHELARHVALVLQDPETQLIANSVLDEVAFGLENLRVPREEILDRIAWALGVVRLEGLEQKHPSELSGGQKQRLAIAAALAMRPKVLVLDEPTSQLDPLGSEQVFTTVRELNARLGITVIMVSHASEELAMYADRIALLQGGALADLGPPERVFARADLLARCAVRPPQVTQFFAALSDRGLTVPSVPVTLDLANKTYQKVRANIEWTAPVATEPPPRDAKNAPLLVTRDLEHVYPDGTTALRGVSLQVHAGEYVAVVGQNGAGKTTLARHFLHLLEPTAGLVQVGSRDVTKMAVSELAQRIGYVAQNPDHQIFQTTVEAEVTFALRHLGLSQAEIERRASESLQMMGLLEVRESHPLALPKGDRARVVIAAVLAMKPEVLIFDEPTTGQDYLGARRILEVSRELQRAGKTIVVITHHLHLLPGVAERVVVLGKGEVLFDGPIRDAFHQTALLAQTFLAPPQIVRLAQNIEEREGLRLPVLTPDELVGRISLRRSLR